MFLLCFCVQRLKFLCLFRQSFSLLGCQSSSFSYLSSAGWIFCPWRLQGRRLVQAGRGFFGDSWCLPFDSALFYFANWKTASTDTIVTFSFVVCSHISAAPCCLAAATWQIQGGGKKKTHREDAISQKHLKNFTATSSPLYWECFVSWHSNNHHELFTLKAHNRPDRAHHPL